MFVLVAGRKMALVQVAEGQDYYNYAGTLGLPNAATTCNLCKGTPCNQALHDALTRAADCQLLHPTLHQCQRYMGGMPL